MAKKESPNVLHICHTCEQKLGGHHRLIETPETPKAREDFFKAHQDCLKHALYPVSPKG